jgi:hypothetical protein
MFLFREARLGRTDRYARSSKIGETRSGTRSDQK